jgi:hypothetical protein
MKFIEIKASRQSTPTVNQQVMSVNVDSICAIVDTNFGCFIVIPGDTLLTDIKRENVLALIANANDCCVPVSKDATKAMPHIETEEEATERRSKKSLRIK